jgi:hypothetical protein
MDLVTDIEAITVAHLDDLHQGRSLALRIKRFIPTGTALSISERLVRHSSLAAYRNTPELVRVGESHFETHNEDGSTDADALNEYLSNADQLMDEIRRACAPRPSPVDQLWRLFDDVGGVERAEVDGRSMFAGIVRIFPEGSELLPHNDVFARDAPDLAPASEITAQFAANIYLEAPEDGGHLQLWGERPNEQRLADIRDEGSKYGASRSLLPPPAVEIEIDPGDLLLIDATRLHAVSAQKHGRRVGMSCFLGQRPGRPFICWS